MIFADMHPGAILGLGAIVFLVIIVILVHWSSRQSAPEVGQWQGSEYVDAPTIAGYLVDPDTKLPYIYVTIHALSQYGERWVIDGKYTYKASPDEICKIKLIRSGTGFRVYGKQDIEGKWLPCR
jgi:hypothetical protein